MLTEPTSEKLHSLRLGAMAAAWIAQREDPKVHEIDFDSRFGMIVDAEHLSRDNKRLVRALREAKLRITNACIEDIDYAAKRELDRTLVRQLGTGAWIASHANVIITGATGTGKSYVACALAQQACRVGYLGYRALCRRAPRLLEELALAHADGTYTRLLGRLAKFDVRVLDDWGLAPLRERERRDMLEIFDDRHAARSAILTRRSRCPPRASAAAAHASSGPRARCVAPLSSSST